MVALQVYPMGWNWAFWLIQRLHEVIAEDCGFDASRRVASCWPAPKLTVGEVCLPYCDNLTVFGLSRADVQQGIDRMMRAFQKLGFRLHEVIVITSVSSPIGSVLSFR